MFGRIIESNRCKIKSKRIDAKFIDNKSSHVKLMSILKV